MKLGRSTNHEEKTPNKTKEACFMVGDWAFACAARDAGDVDETLRLQHLASEWVVAGWSRRVAS